MEKMMRLCRSAILAAICLIGLAADSPAPLKSVVARDAIDKRYSLAHRAEMEYRAKLAVADKQLLASLDQAIREAMADKDLDEATRLNELRKQTAEHLSIEQSQTPGPAITGTRWNYNGGGSIMDFQAGGVITCNSWGAPGKWAPVSDNTVDVIQPDNAYLRLTFAADLKHSLWVEVSPHNTVAYASRADKP